MVRNAVTVQTLLDKYAAYRQAVSAMQNGHKADAARWLNELAQEIMRVVGGEIQGKGAAVVDPDHVKQIVEAIDEAIAQGMKGQGELFQSAYRSTGRTVLKGVPSIYDGFGQSSVGRLNAARGAMQSAARERFGGEFANWANRFGKAGVDLKTAMERELMQAQLYGWDQRTLAGRFVNIPGFDFNNLPKLTAKGKNIFTMGGKLGDSDALIRRAHVIARTELNGVAERMHETWTQEAGFDKYINLNSDPVAEECIAANLKPPMTLEEWDATLGRPPRHPNCDSGLLAVPPESVAEVTAEIKADAKAHEARAQARAA